MPTANPSPRVRQQRSSRRRQIGPLGTVSRLVGGAAAISMPIVLGGFGWWDAAGAFLVFPLISALSATAISACSCRSARRVASSRPAICSGAGCLLIGALVGANSGLAALTPVSGYVAIGVWLGGSMLIAGCAGYGGCELLAIPNLLLRRRDQIGCIVYTPIDRWEAGRNDKPRTIELLTIPHL